MGNKPIRFMTRDGPLKGGAPSKAALVAIATLTQVIKRRAKRAFALTTLGGKAFLRLRGGYAQSPAQDEGRLRTADGNPYVGGLDTSPAYRR